MRQRLRGSVGPLLLLLPMLVGGQEFQGRATALYRCEVGGRPGSTLLFPYFELDASKPDGMTTLISIGNDSDTPTLARVRISNEWGRDLSAFTIVLAKHEVATLNLRDVLVLGNVPNTNGADLIAFPRCLEFPPGTNPVLPPNSWTSFVSDTSCLSEWLAPSTNAKGSIVVDAIRRCFDPSVYQWPPESYFDYRANDGTLVRGIADIKNVLWGDLMLVDPSQNYAQGIEAVAISGDEAFPMNGNHSFYGGGGSTPDKRAPLPTSWTVRYLNGGAFDGGTDLLVYRRQSSGTSCAFPRAPFPLETPALTARDEEGTAVLGPGISRSFPLAVQRVRVSDLRVSNRAGALDEPFGVIEFELGHGGWVIPLMKASGRFSVGLNATPLDTRCP